MPGIVFLLLLRFSYSGSGDDANTITITVAPEAVANDAFPSDIATTSYTSSSEGASSASPTSSLAVDCDKLNLEAENLNADEVYNLKPGAISVDNFGTAFYAIEESKKIKIRVTLKNNGPTVTFCTNETPFASSTSGVDFFVEDNTITSFGRVVETLGCDEKVTIRAGATKTTTLEFSGTLGFGAQGNLNPDGWVESALMSVDFMIPDDAANNVTEARTEVCDLRAETSIKLKPTFRLAEKSVEVKAEIDDISKKDDFCQKMVAEAGEGAKLGGCDVDTSRNVEEANVKLVIVIIYPIDKFPENVEELGQVINIAATNAGVTVVNIEISPPADNSSFVPAEFTVPPIETTASPVESTVSITTTASSVETTASPIESTASPVESTVSITTTMTTTTNDGWSLDNFRGSVEYNDKQVPRFSAECIDYPELTGYKYSDGSSAPCSALCNPTLEIGLLCAQSCGLCSQMAEAYKFVNEEKQIEYTSCDDTQTQTLNDDLAAFYDELCPSILLGFKEDEANATAIFEKWLGKRMTKTILFDEVVQICSLNKFSFHCDPNSVDVEDPACTDSLTSGTVAYVYSTITDPRVIYNCPFYFALPKDMRLSTIFHEISHFTDVTNTNDVPGGYTASNQLEFAKTNTGVTNAGNWDSMSIDSSWANKTWPSRRK